MCHSNDVSQIRKSTPDRLFCRNHIRNFNDVYRSTVSITIIRTKFGCWIPWGTFTELSGQNCEVQLKKILPRCLGNSLRVYNTDLTKRFLRNVDKETPSIIVLYLQLSTRLVELLGSLN